MRDQQKEYVDADAGRDGERDAAEAVDVDGDGDERTGRRYHRQGARRGGEKIRMGDTSIPREDDDGEEGRRGRGSPGRYSLSPPVQPPRKRLIIKIDPTKWEIMDRFKISM